MLDHSSNPLSLCANFILAKINLRIQWILYVQYHYMTILYIMAVKNSQSLTNAGFSEKSSSVLCLRNIARVAMNCPQSFVNIFKLLSYIITFT